MYELEEVAKLSDLSERTLRRYIKKFKLRIGRGSFNKYRFSEEDVKKLVLVRTMLYDGYSDAEIINTLQGGKQEQQQRVKQESLPSTRVDKFKELMRTIKEQDRRTGTVMEKMTRELRTYELLLRQQLRQQAMLMQKITSLESHIKPGFWQRLFSLFISNKEVETPPCTQCGTPNSRLNAFCIGCGSPYMAQPQPCTG